MAEFRKLTDSFSASPQITPADVAEASAAGFALIVNNRPDGEAPDQTEGAAIREAAEADGLGYCEIPVGSAGFSEPQVEALKAALASAPGPVLAYCRSGTRSTLLWALTQASLGEDPERIAQMARAAGYDVAPIRAVMDVLAANQRD